MSLHMLGAITPSGDVAQRLRDDNAVLERYRPSTGAIAGSTIGLVAGLVVGAKVWRAHPVLGALLGGFFVGSPLGAVVGHAIGGKRS